MCTITNASVVADGGCGVGVGFGFGIRVRVRMRVRMLGSCTSAGAVERMDERGEASSLSSIWAHIPMPQVRLCTVVESFLHLKSYGIVISMDAEYENAGCGMQGGLGDTVRDVLEF